MNTAQKLNSSTSTAITANRCYVLPNNFPVDEVLNYVMKDVDKNTFDLGIEKGSFQFLYEDKKKYLISHYFSGNVLQYAITMAEILRPYNRDSLRLKDLNDNIKWLKKRIQLSKKYGGNPIKRGEMIKDYNFFVSEFNEKSRPIRKLINKHLKLNKNGRSISKLRTL